MDKRIGESNIPPDVIEAFDKLDICDLGCENQKECNKLHICPQFFYSGACQYKCDIDGICRFGHDIHSTHNVYILEQIGLEELTVEELRLRLKLLKKQIPRIRICEQYLQHKVDHSEDGCPSLHICNNYLYRACDGQCKLSHDLSGLNCPTVLAYYGITNGDVGCIHKDFQETDHPAIISRFLFDYRKKRHIASGGFGHVYEAEHIIDKQKYAVKFIMFSKSNIETVKKEAELLATLRHENIVRYNSSWIENEIPVRDTEQDGSISSLYGIQLRSTTESSVDSHSGVLSCINHGSEMNSLENPSNSTSKDAQGCLCIQMELCQYISDEDYLTSDKSFKNLMLKEDKFELPLLDIVLQIVSAVAYIHNKGIIHRDLKPDNIFLANEDGTKVKVGDFGLARPVHTDIDSSHKYTGQVGTESYMSPEMQNGHDYDKSTDVYSLGLIILMILYPLSTEIEWLHVLKKTKQTSSPVLPTDIKHPLLSAAEELLKSMLEIDSKKRPDAETVEKKLEEIKKSTNTTQVFKK